MNTLVTGATGFIGQHLVPALTNAGHDVFAGTRRPDSYDGPGRPVHVDLEDPRSIQAALGRCDVVYYLVHSLNTPDFERRDRQLAETFTDAADGRVDQVVYLGGSAQGGEGRRICGPVTRLGTSWLEGCRPSSCVRRWCSGRAVPVTSCWSSWSIGSRSGLGRGWRRHRGRWLR